MKKSASLPQVIVSQMTTPPGRQANGKSRMIHIRKQIKDALENLMSTGGASHVVIDPIKYIGATILKISNNAAQAVFEIIICTYRRLCDTADKTRKIRIIVPHAIPANN
ncbi:MAG: hypothetical protein RLY66_245 [Candidatus Parcubacteria bacterium]|jgi:integrase